MPSKPFLLRPVNSYSAVLHLGGLLHRSGTLSKARATSTNYLLNQAPGGWRALSAWHPTGWPTLCEFVFCKGWDILRLVSPLQKPFNPPPQPFSPQFRPFTAKHLTSRFRRAILPP